ncbi:UvrD-helicase domain-containing protein [Persephonella sp.]
MQLLRVHLLLSCRKSAGGKGMNINYIASAGTGKTYRLVEDVIEKILYENIPLKNMMILTFTEKAGSELKEKIADRIKQLLSDSHVNEKHKRVLHKQLIFIDSGYIGTFHSVFFRLLKKYPQYSLIDDSFEVISDRLDSFLEESFEQWIESSYNEDQWKEIVQLFRFSVRDIQSMFTEFYKHRHRVRQISTNTAEQKKLMSALQKESIQILESIIKQFGNMFDKLHTGTFRFGHPELILQDLKSGKLPKISEDSRPTTRKRFLIKESRSIDEKSKELYKEIAGDDTFTSLDNRLFRVLYSLLSEEKDYRVNLILEKYGQFAEFVDRKKQKEKIIDFSDILIKTENLLKENPDLTDTVKKKFRYIFVDEFQDTDIIQAQILELIQNNNLYTYGDPKQCIYTWRDADLNVYFSFLENNNFKHISLHNNYRSGKNIVEFANSILKVSQFLSHIKQNFKEPSNAVRTNTQSSVERYLIEENDSPLETEGLFTVNLIKQLIRDRYSYEDIMVLFRKNSQMYAFYKILRENKIPAVLSGEENLFSQPEIQLFIYALKYINNPDDRFSILNLLKSPFIYVPDEDIYRYRDSIEELLNKHGLSVIKKLAEEKNFLTVEDILNTLYQETDLPETVCMLSENPLTSQMLTDFMLTVKEKSRKGMFLPEFLKWTETATVPVTVPEDQNGVKLLTIHKSKGLESKVVIIPLLGSMDRNFRFNSFGETFFYDGKVIFYHPIKKTVSKEFKKLKEKIVEERNNEEDRLFYVAVTRPKEKLIFIETENKNQKFYSRLLDETDIKAKRIKPSSIKASVEEPEEQLSENTVKSAIYHVRQLEEKRKILYSNSTNKQIFTSVSKLMEQEERQFSKSSARRDEAIYTGILVHSVLEETDFKNYSVQKAKQLIHQRSDLVPEEIRSEAVKNAEKLIELFENSSILDELKNSQILFREMPFTLYVDGQYIEGRIDVLYRLGNQIVVADFKTNRYKNQREKEEIINSYKKQAEIYTQAVRKIFPDTPVVFKLALLWEGEMVPLPV